MALARALFGSRRLCWETPPELFAALDREFHFTLDVCASRQNKKCTLFFDRAQDGLRQEWAGCCWMNPPYGREIGWWLTKAHDAARRGATVVALLPARTDTAWWHDQVMRAREIRLLRGRVRFVGAASVAPFPSAIVIFENAWVSRLPKVIGWDWKKVVAAHPLAA